MLELALPLYLLKFKESMYTKCLFLLFGHTSGTQKALLTVAGVTIIKDHATSRGNLKKFTSETNH